MSADFTSVLPPKKKMGVGKKILVGVLAFFAFMIILGAVLGKGATSTNSLTPAATPSLTSTPSAALTAKPKPTGTVAKKPGLAQDKSFRLESVSFNTDLGSAGANARVTNISDTPKTGIFGISIFEPDGVTVAVDLMGSADGVQPGQTVTAQFISTKGDLPAGRFKYSFQVSMEY